MKDKKKEILERIKSLEIYHINQIAELPIELFKKMKESLEAKKANSKKLNNKENEDI